MSKKQRHRANRRGQLGEWLAAWALRLKGYTILEKGYRCPLGEIDIIARRLSIVAIVEVKARNTFADALTAIGPEQRGRITRAAEHFLAHRPELAQCDLRFDVVAIMPHCWPKHVADAWRP